MNVLVINCGSSSIKFKLLNVETNETLIGGRVDEIGSLNSFIKINKEEIKEEIKNHEDGIRRVLELTKEFQIDAVGHRVVHGGEKYNTSVIITEEVIQKIEEMSDLAPLHNPANLIGIKACQKVMPNLKHVAVFDTAFHQTIPRKAFLYGIPMKYYEEHKVRKYGFHGPSHEYISLQAKRILEKDSVNIVSCHLGNGASITAIEEGKSIDTSMGFTPISGLIMGTRCGDLDLGIIPFIAAKEKTNLKEIFNMLNKNSGLKGIAGESDFRVLREGTFAGNKQYELALDMFAYRAALYISSYVGILPRVDAITFTAGIGENEWFMREKILSNLKGLNIEVDVDKNKSNSITITKDSSKIKVLVIPTDEEWMIAGKTRNLLQ